MKIEEIKERLENASGEHGWYVMHDTDITYEDPPGSCDECQVCVINNVNDAKFVGNAKDDIKYLLSIIEQAEKKFEQISIITKFLQHSAPNGAVYELSEQALQAIRGK